MKCTQFKPCKMDKLKRTKGTMKMKSQKIKAEIERLLVLHASIKQFKEKQAAYVKDLKQKLNHNSAREEFHPVMTSTKIYSSVIDNVYSQVVSPIKYNGTESKFISDANESNL